MTDHIRYSDQDRALLLLDQRYLPTREDVFACKTNEDIIYALQTMVVRGAPAIGVTAAYGCLLAAFQSADDPDWMSSLVNRLDELENARPTAVNLAWSVNVMRDAWKKSNPSSISDLIETWTAKAKEIHAEDIEINRKMGENGAVLLDDGDTVMTHCNAGALATAGHGTALGVIYSAVEAGKKISVIANETRPFLQGVRLTAYELHKAGVPVKVACDNACALLMQRGLVQKVVVGTDRTAANGDVANKIGTFGVAIMAKRFGIPFYVAAPTSTIDLNTPSGDLIPIEDRTPREVTHVGDTQLTPDGVEVFNYAFDVTPNDLVTGIITEKGVVRAPYTESIKKTF